MTQADTLSSISDIDELPDLPVSEYPNFIWNGEFFIHFCEHCDPSSDPPIVHCPECGTAIKMTREHWHSNGCDETEDEWYERIYGGVQWSESRKGGYYAKHNGMIMIIKMGRDKETYSTCAFIEESEGGKPAIKWKNGHKTFEAAKTYIQAIVDEFKMVKLL